MQQLAQPLPYAQPLAYPPQYGHMPILHAPTQQTGYPIAPSVCPPVRLRVDVRPLLGSVKVRRLEY